MSDCTDYAVTVGCYDDGTAPQSILIHSVYDGAGAPAIRYTDVAGVVIAAATAANVTAGACPVASPDVEWEERCDVQADGSAVKFMCRSITSFAADGTPTTTTDDFALDKVTAYTVTGAVDTCPVCDPLDAGERGVQAAW